MKKILITGANSYIGTSVENWLKQWPEEYEVATIDMIGDGWRKETFATFDTVYHVAGIAHSDSGKISSEKEELYRSVNTDLVVATAEKAKNEGVRQFIFMSSAIVYGESAPIGKEKIITKDTKLFPANAYGDSKLQAEIGIQVLADDDFRVVILRPPMIYGKGSKGNYPTLAGLAKKLPLFPDVDNQRSMLYIENLCQFVKLMIDNNESGVFWPQNKEYSNTSELVSLIAKVHGRKIYLTKVFNWALYLIRPFTNLVDKAFGNLVYEKSMSKYDNLDYQVKDLRESIIASEK